MAKRFECPCCGAGVRPNDIQCFRCGGLLPDAPVPKSMQALSGLQQVKARPEEPETGKVGLANHGVLKASPVHEVIPSPNLKPLTSNSSIIERERMLDRKEKELEERERVMEDSLQQLESDTRSLGDAFKRFEQEEANILERERMLQQREEAMESLAIHVEEALHHLEETEGVSSQMAEEAQRVRKFSEDYRKLITHDGKS